MGPSDTTASHPAMRAANATSYCQAGITASGRPTQWGYVAQNDLPLGTRIRLARPLRGRRLFRVMDRIGWGSEMDFFMWSCEAARQFGRRTVHFRVVG